MFLQVRDTVSLQVAVKLEPGDSLFFQLPSSREQPAAADHLLQEPAAHWQNTGEGREGGPDVTPRELAVTLKTRPPSGALKTLAETQGCDNPKDPGGSAQRPSWGGQGATTYFQLSRELPPDAVQDRLLELVQERGGGAGQDPAGPRAPTPQPQAALPPRGLRNN